MTAILIAVGIVVVVLVGVNAAQHPHRAADPSRPRRALGQVPPLREPGIHPTSPGIERMYQVDIREVLVEAQPQKIITNDNLNAKVDAQVYLKVKPDEENVKASQYNVTNYQCRSSTWRARPCATSSAR